MAKKKKTVKRKVDKKALLHLMKNRKKNGIKKETLLERFSKFLSNEEMEFVTITTTDGGKTFDVETVAEGEPIVEIGEDGPLEEPLNGDYVVEYEGENFSITVTDSVITSVAPEEEEEEEESEEMSAEEMNEFMKQFVALLTEEEKQKPKPELMEMFSAFMEEMQEEEEEEESEEQMFSRMFDSHASKKPNGKPSKKEPQRQEFTQQNFMNSGIDNKTAKALEMIYRRK